MLCSTAAVTLHAYFLCSCTDDAQLCPGLQGPGVQGTQLCSLTLNTHKRSHLHVLMSHCHFLWVQVAFRDVPVSGGTG